ncbi:MAG: hypothetical protein NVS2B7_38220 [Herpetosiphon sp.]
MRTIEELIDQAAVPNGDATEGLPWKYYDLGHGYETWYLEGASREYLYWCQSLLTGLE